MAGNKRKVKTDVPSQTKKPATGRGAKAGIAAAQKVHPQKKQRTGEETKDVLKGQASALSPSTQAQTKTQPLTPVRTPQSDLKPVQLPRPNAIAMANELIAHALRTDPTLLPATNPMTSTHIDAITHAMWQIAFHNGALLQQACSYSAMFSQLKLSTLAKLSFLPSWWFFREMVVKMLRSREEKTKLVIDDQVMNAQWNAACSFCRGVMERSREAQCGDGGDGKAKREETGEESEEF
ncbi:Nn.00g045130.m01.CDS01 [Neocucurbitaria sp. VM-36]